MLTLNVSRDEFVCKTIQLLANSVGVETAWAIQILCASYWLAVNLL